MTNSLMYIVVATSAGPMMGPVSQACVASSSRIELDAWIRIAELHQRCDIVLIKKFGEFREQYSKDHPLIGWQSFEAPRKWKPGLSANQITQEMRDERAAVNDRNDRRRRWNKQLEENYKREFDFAASEYLKKLGCSEADIERIFYLEDRWHRTQTTYKVEAIHLI